MKAEDFDAVVGIDEKVLNTARREYYQMKFEMLFKTSDYIPASLVAEEEDGTVVGFVMGTTYMENLVFSRNKHRWIPWC
jgi:hypothetical protein